MTETLVAALTASSWILMIDDAGRGRSDSSDESRPRLRIDRKEVPPQCAHCNYQHNMDAFLSLYAASRWSIATLDGTYGLAEQC